MPTILPKKSDPTIDNAIATDDDHHEALASDPTITAFPQGSTFGSTTPAGGSNAFTNSSSNTSTFGATSSTGFGATSFGSSPAAGAGTFGSSGFGGSGFGSTPTAGGIQSAGIATQSTQAQNIQSSGGAMQEGAQTLIKTDDKFGDWINKRWRPMMSVIYMLTCFADFVAFPVLWSVLQAMSHGQVTNQWQPLTLQGAGLYHIAMGAVLGLSAYGRSQEKIAGKA